MYDLIAVRKVADVVFGSRTTSPLPLFLSLSRQSTDLTLFQSRFQPDPDGHRGVLQDDDERSCHEGKKINWKDGFKALWYVIKSRFR